MFFFRIIFYIIQHNIKIPFNYCDFCACYNIEHITDIVRCLLVALLLLLLLLFFLMCKVKEKETLWENLWASRFMATYFVL